MRRLLSSDSLIVTQMAGSFLIETLDSEGDGGVEFVDGPERLVCEEVPLEVAPGSLDVIEFGRILWQPLDGQPRTLVEGGSGQLADMDRAVVEHQDHRPCDASWCGPIERVEALEEGDEVGAALGGAAMNDQLACGMVKRADQRQLARLAGRRHAQ